MGFIVLKIDVDTLRGSKIGVPRLARLLERFQTNASFLFSLGPDTTGLAIRRIFRPGFFSKVRRTSVLKHYGLKTLLHGTLLPGPDIGKKCKNELRAIAGAGFECGIHCWNHTVWQDCVRQQDEDWTRKQMHLAYARFIEIFGQTPSTHGAAGWQINPYVLQQLDDWQMPYASDGRGYAAHRLQVGGSIFSHIQIPTTLATLDELIGTPGIHPDNVAAHLLQQTEKSQRDEVFTLHAELEGGKWHDIFKTLLSGWRAQGRKLLSLGEYYAHVLKPAMTCNSVPMSPLFFKEIPGRSGELLQQM